MNIPEGYALDGPPGGGSPPPGYELDGPSSDEGALAAAGRGALRSIPFGQQAAATIAPVNPFSEKGNYSDEMKHLTDAAEASKADHPVAYGTGAVAGTLAPLAIPAVGEALEAAPVLGNAALGAAQSLSDANLTRPTGRDLAGAAIGAGIGGAVGAVGKGLRAVAPNADELAASSAAKGFGTTARNVGKIMGDDPEARLKDLGKWYVERTGAPLADRPGDILRNVQAIHDEAGSAIGEVIDKAAPGKLPDTLPFTEEIRNILSEVEDINPQAQAKIEGILRRYDKLENSGKLDFGSLQKLKSNIGANMGDEPAMQRAYGALADYMNSVVDEAGSLLKDPALAEKYAAAKGDYKNASQLLPILRRAEGRELSQGPVGNSGLLGLFGLGAGVASGHPVGGAAAALGSAIGRPIANMVGRNAALKSVPYIPKIAAGARGLNTAAQLELANALESKFRKEKE